MLYIYGRNLLSLTGNYTWDAMSKSTENFKIFHFFYLNGDIISLSYKKYGFVGPK